MKQKYPDFDDVNDVIYKLWKEGNICITTAKILIELEKEEKAKFYEKDWRQKTVHNLNRWKY